MVSLAVMCLSSIATAAKRGYIAPWVKTLSNDKIVARLCPEGIYHLRLPDEKRLCHSNSPIAIEINGKFYRLSRSRPKGGGRVVPILAAGTANDVIAYTYHLDDIALAEVTYRLAGASLRTDLVLKNVSGKPFDSRGRIRLNIWGMGRRDYNSIRIEGMRFVRKTRIWDKPGFKTFVVQDQEFRPTVVGYGLLQTPPDRVTILTNCQNQYDRQFEWRPPTMGGSLYQYRLMGLFYNFGRLDPGKSTKTVTFFYGAGLPRNEGDPKSDLLPRLKDVLEAAECKWRTDLETMAQVDSMAFGAISENATTRQRIANFNAGQGEGLVQAVVDIGVAGMGDPSGGSLAWATFPFSTLVNGTLFHEDRKRTNEYFAERFQGYMKLWPKRIPNHDQRAKEIRERLEAATRKELNAPLKDMRQLIANLESGKFKPPVNYPHEQMLDALDRCALNLRLSGTKEIVSVSPAASGTALDLRLIGTLGPYRDRIERAGGMEKLSDKLEETAFWTGWGGLATAGTIKVGAALLSSGGSVVVEGIVGTVGLGSFAVATACSATAATVDITSDQIHFLLAVSASTSWSHERSQVCQLLSSIAKGIPKAPAAGESKVAVLGFQVSDAPKSDNGAVVTGQLKLLNATGQSVPIRAVVTVPGLKRGQPPLFVTRIAHMNLPQGKHLIPFRLSCPDPVQITGQLVKARARVYVSVGVDNVLIASTSFKIGNKDALARHHEMTLLKGFIAAGETKYKNVEIRSGAGPTTFYLDYEGSDLDLEIIDPRGRRIAYNPKAKRAEGNIPGFSYIAEPGMDSITITTPLPGKYRLAVKAISAHRKESFKLTLATSKRPTAPVLKLNPSVAYYAPGDDPDLLSLQVMEVTGVVPAGPITVNGLDPSQWRSSGVLNAGGVARLEIRKPGMLFAAGKRRIEVRAGLARAVLQLEPVPQAIRQRAINMVGRLAAVRKARHAILARFGVTDGLWEASRFGRAVRPEYRQALTKHAARRTISDLPAPLTPPSPKPAIHPSPKAQPRPFVLPGTGNKPKPTPALPTIPGFPRPPRPPRSAPTTPPAPNALPTSPKPGRPTGSVRTAQQSTTQPAIVAKSTSGPLDRQERLVPKTHADTTSPWMWVLLGLAGGIAASSCLAVLLHSWRRAGTGTCFEADRASKNPSRLRRSRRSTKRKEPLAENHRAGRT
jgi:hypothetical protein